MIQVRVNLPEWVKIPTSEMGPEFLIGKIVTTWHNNVKVRWWGIDDKPHYAMYRVGPHIFLEPTDADWHAYHDRLEAKKVVDTVS